MISVNCCATCLSALESNLSGVAVTISCPVRKVCVNTQHSCCHQLIYADSKKLKNHFFNMRTKMLLRCFTVDRVSATTVWRLHQNCLKPLQASCEHRDLRDGSCVRRDLTQFWKTNINQIHFHIIMLTIMNLFNLISYQSFTMRRSRNTFIRLFIHSNVI